MDLCCGQVFACVKIGSYKMRLVECVRQLEICEDVESLESQAGSVGKYMESEYLEGKSRRVMDSVRLGCTARLCFLEPKRQN